MAEESKTNPDLQRLKEAIRQTVASGHDLQSRVSELMFSALSLATTRLELSHLRQVTEAALEGVGLGAQSQGAGSAEVIRKSVAGIEEALLKAAGVTKLTIEEAAGHAADFSKTDLAQAMDDLVALQGRFLNVFGDIVKAGSRTAGATITDIQRHVHDSGGTLGVLLADTARELEKLFPPAGRESLRSGREAAGKVAEQLGRMAEELLKGIANRLEKSGERSSRDAGVDEPEEG